MEGYVWKFHMERGSEGERRGFWVELRGAKILRGMEGTRSHGEAARLTAGEDSASQVGALWGGRGWSCGA